MTTQLVTLGRTNVDVALVAGEVAFGGVNDELLRKDADMKFILMSNRTDPPDTEYGILNGTWRVPRIFRPHHQQSPVRGQKELSDILLVLGDEEFMLEATIISSMVAVRSRDIIASTPE
jgi:hypothetical protein